MGNIIIFVPAKGVTASQNLMSFIEVARSKINVFGATLDFSLNEWNVGESIAFKGRYDNVRVIYSNLESTKSNKVPMQEPFLSFAKAFIRYSYGLKAIKNLTAPLIALRILESVLREKIGLADPTAIDANILNRAVQVAKERLAASTAYRTGIQLGIISDFLRTHRLTISLTLWASPISRPVEGTRVGAKYDEERAAKFPSPTALDALPRIFREATEPGDVITSSACALMCSAPDRINEVLLLREACEIEKKDTDGNDHYGLRWWPAKGAEPQIKWIMDLMSDTARSALEKIRAETAEARVIAMWYEKFPLQLYLPDHLSNLRSQEWLSLEEIGDIIFLKSVAVTSIHQWCKSFGVALHKRSRGGSRALFSDVEAAVFKLLPPKFPLMNSEVGLKYSDALFVVRLNELHERKATYRCMFEPISLTNIANRLGRADNAQTIFDRFGIFEPDGSRVYVTTKQFRHYLNTLAHAAGLSQLDIAKWSGRKDLRQNAAYDHESRESLLIKMREAIGDDRRIIGPLSERKITVISRDEFARLKIPTAHTTDFGYCVHDYIMSPCQLNSDCLRCEELVCVKGQKEKEERVRQSLAEAELLAIKAQSAIENNEFGAAEWLVVHSEKVGRLKELVKIFDDPSIASGAFVHQAAPLRPTWMDHAHNDRLSITGKDKK